MCFFVNIAEFFRFVLKNICDRLILWDVISTGSVLGHVAFAQSVILKFLFENENVKIISKLWILKKEKKELQILIYIMFLLCCTLCVYLCMWMLCKSENMCLLNLYSVHAERILDLSQETMLSPSKWGTEHL